MAIRRRYIIFALVALVLIAAGSFHWPVTHLPLTQQLVGRIGEATGLAIRVERASLRLLPTPRIKMSRVSLDARPDAAPETALLSAREVRVGLGLLPLLLGRAEPVSITLVNPNIRWFGPEQPRQLWTLARRHLTALIEARNMEGEPAPGDTTIPHHVQVLAQSLPGRLVISEGAVLYRNGNRRLLHRLNATVDWPSTGRPLDLAASALWRGEPVDLRIEKLRPASLAAGFDSPLALRLSARPATFSFIGRISADEVPELSGDMSFRTSSLRQTAAWLRTPLAFADAVGPVTLKGGVSLSGQGLSVPDARIDAGGGVLEGALSARIADNGRMRVSATLDAATLDFNRFLAADRRIGPARPPGGVSEWSRAPLVRRPGEADFPRNDLDIRLSVARAAIGPLLLSDVAAGILTSGGRLEIALNQAKLDDGLVRGRLQLLPEQDDLSAQLTGTIDGVDARKTLRSLTSAPLISGRAGGQVTLRGNGNSLNAIMRNLAGVVSARITDGELSAVDLNNVVERMEQRPLATALDWRGGRTPFDTIDATLKIERGSGELEGELRAGNGLYGVMSGVIDIAHRTLALRALAMTSEPNADAAGSQGSDGESPAAFPIEIEGSWDYPVVTPDIRSLIERSSAAVPLAPAHTPASSRPDAP
ncbi:AsmA protein [Pseudochelatococcus lubricantis]|uniref:AsmA protein n=1 Tax=Pseudochelatococcus lubricantis TaxID=1538102 RepID=A0ABX0UWC3_9HYPH|nr:AsmA family protein [Pseudochelatococcus lubricantis]NIJ56564.1 AsmA protein [Pseudochelatococcus lubricantis]